MISLDINVTTFVIQLIATAALFVVVAIFFAKPMKNFMAKRHAFVQASFDEAAEAKNSAKVAHEEALSNVKNAKENAHQIIEAAKSEADVKHEAILEQARKGAEIEMKKAQEEIKRERQSMYDQAKKEIASIATSATEKLIKKEIDEKVHDDLFAEFVGLVGGTHE
jgi:F-type H+-transporting ATPase subunit b